VFVSDTLGRVLVYSLKSGEPMGYATGTYPVVAGDVLAVETGGGHASVYDLKTMQRKKELVFATDIVMMRMSPDGQRLFVLTVDQQTAVVNVQ
jgi:hypothetical protein